MSNLATMFNISPLAKEDRSIAIEHTFVLPEQSMGVEIEAEQVGSVRLPNATQVGRNWEIKGDGSLVRGQEYVLARPLEGNDLSRAVSQFFQHAVLTKQATSSTHIHLDMSSDTPATLQVLFALVYMLEPVLWQTGDPSRKWCGFTHPVSMVPQDVIDAMFNEEFNIKQEELVDGVRRISRYFGLNLQALSKYGSFEFRYFPTATSAQELVGWINLVQSFKHAALTIGSMRALNSLVETEEGFNSIITSYFSQWQDVINQYVPYSDAQKSFSELVHSFHAKGVNRRINWEAVATTHQGFGKMAKRRKQRPVEQVVSFHPLATNVADNLRAQHSVGNDTNFGNGVTVWNYDTSSNAPHPGQAPRNILLLIQQGYIYVSGRDTRGGYDSREWINLHESDDLDNYFVSEHVIDFIRTNVYSLVRSDHSLYNTRVDNILDNLNQLQRENV